MKKAAIVSLIIGGVFLTAGIACFVIGGLSCNFDFSRLGSLEFEQKTVSFEGKLSDLELLTINDDIKVKPSQDNKIKLEYCESTDGRITYDISRDYTSSDEKGMVRLHAEQQDNRKWYEFFSFFGFGNDNSLTVYLPQKELEKIALHSVSGDIGSEMGLSSKSSFRADSTSGNITLGNISAVSGFTVSDVSGEIALKAISTSTDIKVNTVSGDIEMSACVAEKALTISTTSGSVSIDGASAENAKLESISGEMRINILDARDIFASSVSGGISGSIGAEGNYSTETVSGDISVPSSSAAERNYRFKTISGNIDLK